MTHGYMFSGSGSNVYVQNLCRSLVREGHDVHLLCQEPFPLSYDFVTDHASVDASGIKGIGKRATPYPGHCAVYNPKIGDLLPVYVYDDYPGWRVKTFLNLTDEEFESYFECNVGAIKAVLMVADAEAVVTNHAVPGPLIARWALEGTSLPYVSIVHGSALQYVSRKSETYMAFTRQGLEGARNIVALSSHSAGTIAEDFPDMEQKTLALPGGVDTDLFRPEAFDLDFLKDLDGGPGRGPEQKSALEEALRRGSDDAEDLAEKLRAISATYDARAHDRDAGKRLKPFLSEGSPLVIYVGKLIHSKGVHALLSAFARTYSQTEARLLVVGYGTFREGLEALTLALSAGDQRTAGLLIEGGRLFEGGSKGSMEHLELSEELFSEAEGLDGRVEFVGPLYHKELAKLLPVAEVAVVPSIFPETFGLVAAEFAAAGVVPFVADHSGLREAGKIVGGGLPFDLRISMEGLEKNLAYAMTDYLALTEQERRECRETVRRNAVEHLSWGNLAERLAEIAGGR